MLKNCKQKLLLLKPYPQLLNGSSSISIIISDKKSENPKEISLIKDLDPEQHQDEMVPIALMYSLFSPISFLDTLGYSLLLIHNSVISIKLNRD